MTESRSAGCRRRAVLGAMVGGVVPSLWPSTSRAAPDPIPYHGGRITPAVPVPALAIELADGSRTDLASLLRGHATAVHLMFSGCSTTCPIQGVVFRRVQELLPDHAQRGIQLLSLSVDPLEDTPSAMRNWLARFQSGPGWLAARSLPDGLDTVQRLFGAGSGDGALADHATEVSIVNQRANLIWRTTELPSAESLADMLKQA